MDGVTVEKQHSGFQIAEYKVVVEKIGLSQGSEGSDLVAVYPNPSIWSCYNKM